MASAHMAPAGALLVTASVPMRITKSVHHDAFRPSAARRPFHAHASIASAKGNGSATSRAEGPMASIRAHAAARSDFASAWTKSATQAAKATHRTIASPRPELPDPPELDGGGGLDGARSSTTRAGGSASHPVKRRESAENSLDPSPPAQRRRRDSGMS
jgi:hypothetical protein